MRPPSLLTLFLLLLAAAAGPSLAFRRRECSSETPVCRSDRFDVVFSHLDENKCKVFTCKCREPAPKTCPQGQAKLQVDSDGCQFYDCQSCPPRPVCQGSQTLILRGNDANGCPIHQCECPVAASRPQCGTNQQIQQGTDSSGCAYFFCQQTRVQCPETPTCSSSQQLVSKGLAGDCQIYKCECLTPAKITCSIGSQARLQDDGLGCQVYRCQENRSPCPAEPTCPSSHQMVTQDGVDANNCIKYVCKCVPLAPVTCPSGFLQKLTTDESCGCQYYKCTPNCEQKPNCPSVYQEAVISGTRNNACPTYSCQCKNPEVISCTLTDAHLVLSKAVDGSNCDIYVCQTKNSNTKTCRSVPICPPGKQPVMRSFDSQGCADYVCSDGGSSTCPPPRICNLNELQHLVGRDSSGCSQYVCHKPGCTLPPNCGNQPAVLSRYVNACPEYECDNSHSCLTVPACPLGQVPLQIGYVNGRGSCPQYVCQPINCPAQTTCGAEEFPSYVTMSTGCVSVSCRRTPACRGMPACRSGETPQVTGTDLRGCTRYVCYRPGCTNPPVCPMNQVVITNGYDATSCATYSCQNDNGCQESPTCLLSETQLYIGQDSNGCSDYICHRIGCPPPPTCTFGERTVASGGMGSCRTYSCQSTKQPCPLKPTCSSGQAPNLVSYDPNSCPVYSCPTPSGLCTTQPSCPLGQSAIFTGTDAFGCPSFACQFNRHSCPYPPVCPGGLAAEIIGRDNNDCPIYGNCLTVSRDGGIIGANGGVIIGGLIGGSSTCPQQPECQYQQLRIRSQSAQGNGQVCEQYTCIDLGDYNGRPPKCHDNPTYCEITQTVETYVEKGKNKPCQRVLCKASSSMGSLFGFK